MSEQVVLSYGMGVDSTAILRRWLTEPASRDFELTDLIVITSMTGDEFSDTGDLVRAHILNRLSDAGVRFVQVARAGPRDADGIVVLDDSRSPSELHLAGCYKLSDELRAGGTVPQVAAGRRTCSIKFKGHVLDAWIDAHITGPYRHVLGFNADEDNRAERDSSYGRAGRICSYPLIEWGWGRQRCETYLAGLVGRPWPKSCCTYCPFAGSAAGIDAHLARWRRHPEEAFDALLLEHVSVALNPNVALFGKRRAIDTVGDELRDAFIAHLVTLPHALYDVRRILLPRRSDPTKKAPGWRSVRQLSAGGHRQLTGQLLAGGGELDIDGMLTRRWYQRRGVTLPTCEHLHVVAPVGVADKQRVGFDGLWSRLQQLSLLDPAA